MDIINDLVKVERICSRRSVLYVSFFVAASTQTQFSEDFVNNYIKQKW